MVPLIIVWVTDFYMRKTKAWNPVRLCYPPAQTRFGLGGCHKTGSAGTLIMNIQGSGMVRNKLSYLTHPVSSGHRVEEATTGAPERSGGCPCLSTRTGCPDTMQRAHPLLSPGAEFEPFFLPSRGEGESSRESLRYLQNLSHSTEMSEHAKRRRA